MLTIWRFTDGKRGHDNQTLGLIEALSRLTPCQLETVPVAKGWPCFFAWLLKRFPTGKTLPKPDLIIGAGHATHWPMLAARRAHGGKIAVLMKPSLPLSWFDFVIAPEHDFPDEIPPGPPLSRGGECSTPLSKGVASRASRGISPLDKGGGEQSEPGDSHPHHSPSPSRVELAVNPLDKGGSEQSEPGDSHPHPNSPSKGREEYLLTTVGPINRIQPGQQDQRTGLMLIGGPSSEYGWSETALLKQIHLIALHQPQVNWHLTNSRRTPMGFLINLQKLNLPNLQAVAHDKVSADWLPVNLTRAGQVWVTPDSASMVYEALTSGAAVGCFELPYLKPGRVARGLGKLVAKKRLTSFADWQTTGKLPPNAQPLNEAERSAKTLLSQLTKNG